MRIKTLLAAVATAMLACGSVASSQTLTDVKIVISSPSIPGSTARIAKEMGLFEKQGLNVSVSAMDSNNVATTALMSGSAQFATTAASDLVIVRARGQDMVGLFSSYRGFAAVLVLSKAVADKTGLAADAPIAQKLKALNGLTIASPSPTSTFTVATKSAAEGAGAKVNFVYMGQTAMISALQTGAIQGFVANAPYYLTPVVANTGVIWVAGPKGEYPANASPANSTVVMASRSYVKANRDIARRVVAGFAAFGKAAKERPDEMKAAIARLFPDVDPKTIDLLIQTEAGGFAITPLTVDDVAHDIDFVKASGIDVPGIDALKPADMIEAVGQ